MTRGQTLLARQRHASEGHSLVPGADHGKALPPLSALAVHEDSAHPVRGPRAVGHTSASSP